MVEVGRVRYTGSGPACSFIILMNDVCDYGWAALKWYILYISNRPSHDIYRKRRVVENL
jgi:hypothetical protein